MIGAWKCLNVWCVEVFEFLGQCLDAWCLEVLCLNA